MTLPDGNPIRDGVTKLYKVWMDQVLLVQMLEERVRVLEQKLALLTRGDLNTKED